MKHSKKMFVNIAMALCFSFCISIVSHAKTIIEYKETNYGKIVEGLRDVEGYVFGEALRINSSGKLEMNLSNYYISKAAEKKSGKSPKKTYRKYAHVTFNSKGKKKVNAIYDVYRKPWDKYVYGNQVYGIYKKKLIVHSRNGKVLKTINIDVSKYRKKDGKLGLYIKMAEIAGKNKVRLYYGRDGRTGYGGIIEVNIKTEKIKKIISTDRYNYVPMNYDGKYVYGYKVNSYDEITFYRTSLKTKKTESFMADAITFDREKYFEDNEDYTFYNGCIMGLAPDGRVFYGTFGSKKFEQIGDISKCENYKKYKPLALVMRNKNEFYIMYDPTAPAHMDPDGIRGSLFIVKYKKK